MVTYAYENSFRTTLVCIDEYDTKILKGRIYNPQRPQGVEFSGAIDFLLNMEKLFEEAKCPQAFATLRTFRPYSADPEAPALSGNMSMEGKLATFSLRILFRQNSSWQGSIMWHEGRSEESFRSVLELLLLMDSALSAKE